MEELMTISEISKKYRCGMANAGHYIRKFRIPVMGHGISLKNQRVNLYPVTPELDAALSRIMAAVSPWQSDEERHADGWYTADEIGAEIGCSARMALYVTQAYRIECRRCILYKHQRNLFHIEDFEEFRRKRHEKPVWIRAKEALADADDWLDLVTDPRVRAMVEAERHFRRLIGHAVIVSPRGGQPFEAELKFYSMVRFGVQADGKTMEYRTKEAALEEIA